VPGIWGAFQISREDTPAVIAIGIGALLAALCAGVVSWLLNSALQYYHRKRRAAERKKSKKK
jgi:hypothetical protein